MQANFHTADTLSRDCLYESPLVLGPCKLNIPVGTGSKLCICFLHGKVAMHCLSQGIHSERLFSFSVVSKSSKLVKVLPTYNESSSGTDSSVAAMLTKTEEVTDSWTEPKIREKILSQRLVC